MKDSPTQRALAFYRAGGYHCQVVERYCQYSKRRIDLFGFIDIIAIHPGIPGCLGIQATSGSHHANRKSKLIAIEAAKVWLETGNRITVISFTKKGPRGKRKLWEPRLEAILIGDFA